MMTDTSEPTALAGPAQPAKTYDGSISDMIKMLINDLVDEANSHGYGDTAREKIRSHLKHGAGENTMHGITALSAYVQARAAERQAIAMESLAKTASKLQVAESLDSGAQAIVDQREPRRDYLASTYSLPTETLSLLWSIRGMLVDASIRALSKPDRFDPYRKVTTEEIAWTLRVTDSWIWEHLPRTPDDDIDYALLEDFDIVHYRENDDGSPDDWLYGG